ncbi:MAG: thermosome subunit beta [Promethearchaeota archaeon]
MAQLSGVPILILKEGTEDKREKEARNQNINAIMAIAETVRSTLGPKGMDKMLVDGLGDVTITNDGAEILKNLDIENVAANMAVNLAKNIDDTVGDGTTSVVIFAAALLKNALELTEQDIHTQPIRHGFKLAADKAIEIINQIEEKVSKDDDQILKNAAITAMNSKEISTLKEFFAELAIKAVKQISGDTTFDKVGNIKIVKAPGKSLKDSEVIQGLYLEKSKANPIMPDMLKDAKIAVVRKKLDVVKTEFDAQIQIFNPADIKKFLDQEEKMLHEYVKIFKNLGVTMIVNNKEISDKFAAYLAKEGISAIKNLSEDNLKAILKAVDANLVDDLNTLSEADLGCCDKVKFQKIENDEYTLFEGCKNPKAISIVLKGGLKKILDTAEVALHDVLSVVAKIIDTQAVVAGGGATYMELSKRLRAYANEVSGKEQLAVLSFALALEEIPKVLVQNSGLDEVEKMTKLRAAHKTDADKWIGIDTISNTIENTFEKGIIEPAALVKHVIKAGVELANLILRVDRIIAAKSASRGGFEP